MITFPRAKYGDSVIIKRDNILYEILINEVRGYYNENGELFWVYYRTGKDGYVYLYYDDDILLNLTTNKSYEIIQTTNSINTTNSTNSTD